MELDTGSSIAKSTAQLRVFALTQSRVARLFISSLRSIGQLSIAASDGVPPLVGDSVSLGGYDIALIEVGRARLECRALSELLRRQLPRVPQVALLHSIHGLEIWHVEALVALELAGIVDMEATPGELIRVLRCVVDGNVVLQLKAKHDEAADASVSTIHPHLSRDDQMLLRLAARGRSETEMAAEMQLSGHTIHHRLERLRAAIGLRNRIELAAWAGARGYYEVPHTPEADRVYPPAEPRPVIV